MMAFVPGLRCALLALSAMTVMADTLDETLAQARKLRRTDEQPAAIELLEAARNTLGAQPAIDGLLGTLYLEVGQVSKARSLAEGLADQDGSNYRALLFCGRFAEDEDGDLERALQWYRQAAKVKAQPLEALESQVALFLTRSQFGKAAKRAESIAAFDPETGRQLLADIYMAQADGAKQGGAEMLPLAISRYRMALQQRPASLAIVRKLLDVLLLSIHLDEARELNDAAFAAEDQRAERLFWSGRAHESARDIEAARRDYRESYSLQPDQGTVCLHLARLALSDGQSDTAREWLSRAINAMGESPRSLVLMAEVHNGLGDGDAALSCLDRAIAIDRGNAGAHYQRARTLLRLGRRKEGAAAMQQFLAIQQAARPALDDG